MEHSRVLPVLIAVLALVGFPAHAADWAEPGAVCPGQSAAAASEGSDSIEFRAAGREPDWALELNQAGCFLFTAHGSQPVYAAIPAAMEVDAGGVLYGARDGFRQVDIGIERRVCRDAPNSAAFTHAVTVRVNGAEYRGCGRAN